MITATTQNLTIPLPQWQYQQLQQKAAHIGVQPVDIVMKLLDNYFASPEFQTTERDLESDPEIDISFLFKEIDRESLRNPTHEQVKEHISAYRTFMDIMSRSEYIQSLSDKDIDLMCMEARQVVHEKYRAMREEIPTEPVSTIS